MHEYRRRLPRSAPVALTAVAIVVQIPLTLMVLYLDLLSVAAILWRRHPAPAMHNRRFALLIPAHDEEVLLPQLLRSIAAMSYPRDRYDVHVVADNCTDGTAALAAAAGATVHERTDHEQRGKGYALRWLLAQLDAGTARAREQVGAGERYDAYVVVDADSVVSAGFLDVMNQYLERGDQAIQGYYGVLNDDESWAARLRYVALALYNGLRPRGRDALGLSAGLRGNGMCFAAPVLERFGWEAFTLAEDAEFHLQLVEAGLKVSYASEAVVLAEMPATLRHARSQNLRWERGRLQMLRTFGPRLFVQGLRRADPVRLDAMAEQLVPPLSVLTGLAALNLLLTAALRLRGPRRLAAGVLLGQVAYVATGLRLVRAGRSAYTALLLAPFYVLWKVWVYLVAATGGLDDGRWVRTRRAGDGPSRDSSVPAAPAERAAPAALPPLSGARRF